MENYIVINGKKDELTLEQLEALGIEIETPNVFTEVNNDKAYYIAQLEDRNKKLENALRNLVNSSSNYRDATNKVIEHLLSRLALVEREKELAVRDLTKAMAEEIGKPFVAEHPDFKL